MKKTIKTLAAVIATLAMTACGGEKFNITGHITGAADSLLYLENMALSGPQKLDSLRLGADGAFAFEGDRPEAPDFFRLRIAGQAINIAVDSTETITVNADYATMPTDYNVEGSENSSRIKELSLRQMQLQRKVFAIDRNTSMAPRDKQDSIMALIAEYKTGVKHDYVFRDPRHSSSYFALFQTVGRYLIFNPYGDHDDMKAFAAVATCWDAFYPEAERSKNLHNITIAGINNIREAKANAAKAAAAQADTSKIVYSGLIDIALPNAKGDTCTLSSLRGKVVMLDFHVFAHEQSPERILLLRELYSKYRNRGFEIYQVSLDANEHFWMQQVAALPWVSVRDEAGPSSVNLAIYNISELPDFFLIDRDNNLVCRRTQIEDVEKEIERLIGK